MNMLLSLRDCGTDGERMTCPASTDLVVDAARNGPLLSDVPLACRGVMSVADVCQNPKALSASAELETPRSPHSSRGRSSGPPSGALSAATLSGALSAATIRRIAARGPLTWTQWTRWTETNRVAVEREPTGGPDSL